MNHIHTEGQTDRQPKEYKEKVKKGFWVLIFFLEWFYALKK